MDTVLVKCPNGAYQNVPNISNISNDKPSVSNNLLGKWGYCPNGVEPDPINRVNRNGSNISVLHLNAQSIRSKKSEFINLLDKYHPTIAVLTEHWLSKEEIGNFVVPNYVIVTEFCRTVSKHGGAAILVRKDLEQYCAPLEPVTKMSVESEIEMCAINVKIGDGYKVNVIGIYKPPSTKISVFWTICKNYFS